MTHAHASARRGAPTLAARDTQVAVVGGGVVGCAVAHALARRGVESIVLEAEAGLALGASGTNSGILHTGFDSPAGTLETQLILRAGALRREMLAALGVAVRRCGARLTPHSASEARVVAQLARDARANGVQCTLLEDGSLLVAEESVTDPVAYVHALAGAASAPDADGSSHGCAAIELDSEVCALARDGSDGVALTLLDGRRVHAHAAVNAAGLFADELARAAGDEIAAVYPRKGEFLVFAAPADEPLTEILLPVPSALGKGVLVFPTLDGHVIAGPTARERSDKRDWSVEADAAELITSRAIAMFPALEHAVSVGSYAGLRPAGRDANYVIEHSRALPGLVHVAAIRSTGLSASLAIGEHVAAMLAETERVALGPQRALRAPARERSEGEWWKRAAAYRAAATPPAQT